MGSSRVFRTSRHILSSDRHAVGASETAHKDAVRSKHPNFRQTPASVATVSMARRCEALRTVAMSACPDRFGPYSRDPMQLALWRALSVEYGLKRSGHADMATVLSASPRLSMDTVATEAGVCRKCGYVDQNANACALRLTAHADPTKHT